jgi:hypothetical protein
MQKYPKKFANYITVPRENYREYQNSNIPSKFFSSSTGGNEVSSEPGDAASVLSALQQCPPPPAPTPEINNSAVKDAANAMGIRSCSTTTTNVSFGFCSVAIMGCAAAQGTHTENLGCETVQVIADKFRQTSQNINCILNTNVRTLDVSIRSSNTVKFSATNHSEIKTECPSGFKIGQTSTIKYIDLQTITTDQIAQIADQVKTTANDIVKAVQNNEAGYAGTPIGSKFVSDSQKQIDSIDFKQQVKQSIDQIKVKINSNNEVEFLADNYSKILITGNDCEIKQNTLIDMMSTKIMNDTISAVFTTKVESEVKRDVSAESKNVSQSVPDTIGSMFKAIGGLAAMGLIFGIIIVIGIIMIVPSLLKSAGGEKKGVDNVSENLSSLSSLSKLKK